MSREKATTVGIGSNSTVLFSFKYHFANDYFVKDKKNNLFKAKNTPLESALGHELIHGLHYSEGTGDYSREDYSFIISGFQDGKYLSGEAIIREEPGEIKRSGKNGQNETKIGEDGRAVRERHHSDHGTPNIHSKPHNHDIRWNENGKPEYSKPINYRDGDIPEL